MDNARIIWNSKDEIFKILQPFRIFGSIRSRCEIQGKGSFQTVHLEKNTNFRHQSFKLCDSTGYTYYINIYLCKDRKGRHSAWQTLTSVTNLTRGVWRFVQKLCMDNFSSRDMFDDLVQKKQCGTVRLHRKGMTSDLKPKTVRLKRGDIWVKTSDDLKTVVWRDRRDVCLLTNIHDPPSGGNYRDEYGNAKKPAIVADYNRYIGNVDSADWMVISYTASRWTWKWTKKNSTC